ncbi:MAG TPA: hypothetical protein VEL51_03690 [Vicinamibacterales bacterium]|nr:hypothetical protein [Vicinamibacterales bacterium]
MATNLRADQNLARVITSERRVRRPYRREFSYHGYVLGQLDRYAKPMIARRFR